MCFQSALSFRTDKQPAAEPKSYTGSLHLWQAPGGSVAPFLTGQHTLPGVGLNAVEALMGGYGALELNLWGL